MKIEMGKTYRYRNGVMARILAIDAPGGQPVISMAVSGDGPGDISRHQEHGAYYNDGSEFDLDLFEVISKPPRFHGVYADGSVGYPFKTVEEVASDKLWGTAEFIGTLRVQIVDGEPQFEFIKKEG